jgi:hypothetical protein
MLIKLLLMGWLGVGFVSVADAAQERRGDRCGRNDRVTIEDLNMSPDPIAKGQRVRSWQVRLNFQGRRDCETEIEIRDRENNVLAREERVDLRRGINEIRIRPDERFQFRGGEHCLRVIVSLEGTRKDVDARRRFCARQRPTWSLREDVKG